jgi:hypothetical protein
VNSSPRQPFAVEDMDIFFINSETSTIHKVDNLEVIDFILRSGWEKGLKNTKHFPTSSSLLLHYIVVKRLSFF